jgi:Flp pilus assembly protein TadG
MNLRRLLSMRGRAGAFSADERAVAATEFAVLLPLMITLYLGGVEVSQAVAVDRKATLVAHAVADLVAQDSAITDAEMTNILNAAASVAAPYPVAKMKVIVSSVAIDNGGVAKVAWSDTLNGTKRSTGEVISLPAALSTPNTSLIMGEVTYAYKPVFGWVLVGTINLYDKTFLRPRLSTSVTRCTSNC